MNKEKQIEEMANIINEMDEPNAHYYDENLEQHEAFADCFTIAKHLYEKGYRKASEVVEEVFEWLEEKGFLNIEVWAIQEVKDALKKKYTEEGK